MNFTGIKPSHVEKLIRMFQKLPQWLLLVPISHPFLRNYRLTLHHVELKTFRARSIGWALFRVNFRPLQEIETIMGGWADIWYWALFRETTVHTYIQHTYIHTQCRLGIFYIKNKIFVVNFCSSIPEIFSMADCHNMDKHLEHSPNFQSTTMCWEGQVSLDVLQLDI